VLFHPRQDLILSNSEDKTIRVWDVAKRSSVQTFRREHDRFWILTAHPEVNLFAAGHDTGLIVFKLERERPAYVAHRNQSLYYVKDRYLRFYDFQSSRDVPVLSIRRSTNATVRTVAYNPQDRAILLCADADGGHYELYQIPRDSSKRGGGGGGGGESDAGSVESKRGLGLSAVFVGRKRFAVLKGNEIIVKNLKNEEVKRCTPPTAVDRLFAGPIGTLLLRSDDRITLYDIQQRRALAELQTPLVKFVAWSFDKAPLVALVSKDTLVTLHIFLFKFNLSFG
jgi:coatomer protein complex subunit alpha (xenin)